MDRYEKLAGRVVEAISDLPFPVEKSEEDRMEAELDAAISVLGQELKAGKKGFYGEPGRTICVNVAMMGALNFWELALGRIGWDAKRGVLSVNPGWHTPRMGGRETLGSYEWPSMVNKVVETVRNSEPVHKVVLEMLDRVEKSAGVVISDGKRREIVKFVEQSAMRRMGVNLGFMSGGKKFQVVEVPVVASSSRTAVKKWDLGFMKPHEAAMLGTQHHGIGYVPFHQLSYSDQVAARGMYPHKAGNVGAKYPFVDEHYYYPVDSEGVLWSGRAQRVLAIPYDLIMDEGYMAAIGYKVSPNWKGAKTAGIYDMVADVMPSEMSAEFARYMLRRGGPSMVPRAKVRDVGNKVLISGVIRKTEHAVAYPAKEGSSVGIIVEFSREGDKGRADMKLWIDGRHVDGNADVSRSGDELERWVANVSSTVGQMVYVNAG